MVQCPNCGVEAEENANFCSLCGEPLMDKTTENTALIKSGKLRREEKLLTDYQRLTGFQKRKIFWQISGLILYPVLLSLYLSILSGTEHHLVEIPGHNQPGFIYQFYAEHIFAQKNDTHGGSQFFVGYRTFYPVRCLCRRHRLGR
jgi:hypothetical protein